MFCKNDVPWNFQNSQENTSAGVSVLIKFQDLVEQLPKVPTPAPATTDFFSIMNPS